MLFIGEENVEDQLVDNLLSVDRNSTFRAEKKKRKLRVDQTFPKEFSTWTTCTQKFSHRLDYVSDELYKVQRHLPKTCRLNAQSSVLQLCESSRPRSCGLKKSNNSGLLPKSADANSLTSSLTIKSEESTPSPVNTMETTFPPIGSTGNNFNYHFEHHGEHDSYARDYRRQITKQTINRYLNYIYKSPYCKASFCFTPRYAPLKNGCRFGCQQYHLRPQRPITKASFVCYNLNFDGSKGMETEYGCLRICQTTTKGSCESKQDSDGKKSTKGKSYKIPNITLPSLRALVKEESATQVKVIYLPTFI